METNTITQADYTELCSALPDASVDMILTDLPYGTTACSWDSVVPFDEMWHHFTRVIKPRGAIVTTAAQPFTSALVMSNPTMFKYEWIWDKIMVSGIANAKKMPLRNHESILVFCKLSPPYYPQYTDDVSRSFGALSSTGYKNISRSNLGTDYQIGVGYPKTIVKFARPNNLTERHCIHPTQKPVALFEYLIRTYTQAGDIVLDPFAGSGTTAVACIKTNRRYICGDQSAKYVELARKRIATCDPYQDTPVDDGVTQLSMFSSVSEVGHD